MEYTTLGDSGLEVSRIGLGTWAIGGWMWDGMGRSEEIVGDALQRHGLRDQVVLATKCGLNWSDDHQQVWREATRDRILREVDDSLRRLRTDRIDLYQMHWPDPKTPIDETARAGDDLRQVDPKFQQPRFGQYLAAVSALDAFAQEYAGKDVMALALRWLLDQPGHSVALWGARRPEQLDAVSSIDGWRLDDGARERIDALIAEHVTDPVGPEFMAPGARD